jgi:putative transposase
VNLSELIFGGLTGLVGWGSKPMNCPRCPFPNPVMLAKPTSLGYLRFWCEHCERTFNERTGTPFYFLEVPTDIMFQVVLWRVRYKLSLRDLAEMFLQRGFSFTHETVRDWEVRFGRLLAEHLRRKRRQHAGLRWYVDETYIAVKGQWAYLYRAIDSDGQLVDSLLSEHRDLAAAKAFFESARAVVGRKPQQVTTDGHTAYPRAIQETLGKRVVHRIISCLGNPIEQHHRGIKQQAALLSDAGVPGAGDGSRVLSGVRRGAELFSAAAVSLGKRRELFIGRYLKLQDQFCVAV